MSSKMNFEGIDLKRFQKILKRNGYALDRTKGSHLIYTAQGKAHISISKNLNPVIALRLIKENNLIIE